MDTRIRYMAMARENEKIINQGVYEAGREVFHFASPLSRLEEAEIYGPKVLEEMVSSLSAPLGEGRISVVEGDTLAHAAEGVLNFANAFTPRRRISLRRVFPGRSPLPGKYALCIPFREKGTSLL